MNYDIPDLKACKRLAKAWPADENRAGQWYRPDGKAIWAPLRIDEDFLPAYTIGEMLAECKREGWKCELVVYGDITRTTVRLSTPSDYCPARSQKPITANALAIALAQAKEKEADDETWA